MSVEILDDAMLRIAPPDRSAERLGSGYGGPSGPAEGPVWIREEGYLLFSDIHGSRRMKWRRAKASRSTRKARRTPTA